MTTLKLLCVYLVISVAFAMFMPPIDLPTERSKSTGELCYWPAIKPSELRKHK